MPYLRRSNVFDVTEWVSAGKVRIYFCFLKCLETFFCHVLEVFLFMSFPYNLCWWILLQGFFGTFFLSLVVLNTSDRKSSNTEVWDVY